MSITSIYTDIYRDHQNEIVVTLYGSTDFVEQEQVV